MTIEDILRGLSTEDPDLVRETAFRAGEQALIEAVPALSLLLASPNLGIQEAADRALREIGGQATVRAMIPLLKSESAPVRNLSMDILRGVGNQDFTSIVSLLKDEDPDLRIFGADILGSTANPAAVAPLGEALLKDPEVNVRYQAAISLGQLACSEAAESLGAALGDEEWVQFAVVESLARIRDDSSVEALTRALGRSSELVSSVVVDALAEMGNMKAASILLSRMDHSSQALSAKMARAVVAILGPRHLRLLAPTDQERLAGYLLAGLGDEDPDMQDAAIKGLAILGFKGAGERATREILALAAALDPDRDSERLIQAVEAIKAIGLNTELVGSISLGGLAGLISVEAVARIDTPEAWACLMAAYPTAGESAESILAALARGAGPQAEDFFCGLMASHIEEPESMPVLAALAYFGRGVARLRKPERLITLLEHGSEKVREAALQALVGQGGERARAIFEAMAEDGVAVRRLAAVRALGLMDAAGHAALLRRALGDDDADVRRAALSSMAGLVEEDGDIFEEAARALFDPSHEVRLAAVDLLAGSSRLEAVERLIEGVDDQEEWVRIKAVEALGARRAAPAVERLVGLLSGPDKLVALKAAEALGRIGGRVAFQALMTSAGSDDPEIQEAVEAAIHTLEATEQGEDI